MQHRIVLGIALFLLAFSLQAQSNKMVKRDSFPSTKWEIGLDVLSLFEKNNVPAASIFFRRNYAQSAFRGKAWRFQVGMDTEVRNYDSNVHFVEDTYRNYGPYLGVGHEWQFHQKRFTYYAATDLAVSYLLSNTFLLLSISDSTVVDSHRETLRISGAGIIGAQWAFNRYFSIALESSALIQYESFYLDEPVGKYGTPQDAWSQSIGEDQKFTTSIQPFWTIRLIYKLTSKHEFKHEH